MVNEIGKGGIGGNDETRQEIPTTRKKSKLGGVFSATAMNLSN